VAAGVTALVTAGLVSLPGYRDRVATALRQVRGLPLRVHMSLDAIRADQLGEPYRVVYQVARNTFPDAVILVSDAPEDPLELRSIAWNAYYLYPRVIVHRAGLDSRPGLEADFIITTPHFHPGVPDSGGTSPLRLLPGSDRARRYATEHWE
jgi:hypothetical protein